MNRPSFRQLALVTSLVAVASCAGGDDSTDIGPIEAGLRLIPEGAPFDLGDGVVEVHVGDLVALADVAGLDAPQEGRDADDVADWLIDLRLGVDDDRSDATVLLPPLLERLPDVIVALDADLGVDVGAATSYAFVNGGPGQFTVLSGGLSYSTDAGLEGGFGSLGDGDDGEIDFERVSPYNPIGKVLRLGERDGAIAISDTTGLVQEWLEPEEDTLAEDGEYLEIARALDGAGAIAAFIVDADFGTPAVGAPDLLDPPNGSGSSGDEVVIDEQFDVVALGTSVVDGDVRNVVAYLFDDEDEAASAVSGIDEAWSDAQLFERPDRIEELYELESVEQDGAVVVVSLVPLQGRDTLTIAGLLFTRDVPFRHS